jgi:branched-subunit amino acid transport protein
MSTGWLIAGMVVVTYAVRWPVMALVGRIDLPEGVLRALKYVPPAVLTAIVVPGVLMPAGTVDLSWQNAYLIGGIAAAVVAWRSRSLLATILLGMAVFLGWRFFVG